MLATRFETHHDGRRLRVARLGSGPPLVLLHGYPDTLQIWSELAPRLADIAEVIAFDWPGMGGSEAWPGGATPAHMADRLVTLLDDWNLPRVAIVGMDVGGQPALAFAAKYRERITQLVVMNSLVYGDEPTSWDIRILRKYGWNRVLLNRLPAAVFRRALWTFLPRHQTLSSELRKDFWDHFSRPEVRRFISKLCAGYQGSLSRLPQLYSQITCPTLVLWGPRDRHFPIAHATRLHADIRGSGLELVPGGEHWMMWDRAEDVAAHIRAFLKGSRIPASET
jgi:pimeloyl-ACP methyl ester carboxylesterase